MFEKITLEVKCSRYLQQKNMRNPHCNNFFFFFLIYRAATLLIIASDNIARAMQSLYIIAIDSAKLLDQSISEYIIHK